MKRYLLSSNLIWQTDLTIQITPIGYMAVCNIVFVEGTVIEKEKGCPKATQKPNYA